MPSLAEIQQKIIAEARRQGVDPALALGIAQAESSFNPNAVGDNGKSIGLFQLQPAAAQDVGMRPEERYDVDKNIAGGLKYLKNRLRREGDEDRGISAYNQGIGMRGGQLSNPQYVRTVRQYQQAMQPVVARGASSPGLLARISAPGTAAARRAQLPPQPSLTQRLAAWMSPASAAAEPATMAPGAIDWNRELLGTPAPATSAPAPTTRPPPTTTTPTPTPAAIDWHQELLGTPQPLAEQEAAATQQALYGRPAGSPVTPQTLETPEATMRRIPTPAASAPPRSPALAAEQEQAAQRPWWQRTLSAVSEASPELALSAPDLPQIEQAAREMTPEERQELRRREGETQLGIGKVAAATGVSGVSTGVGSAIGGAIGSRFGVPGLGAALGGIAGSYVGRKANVVTGLEEGGPGGDVLSIALPAGQALWGAGKAGLRGLVKGSRGWKAVQQADEATAAAQKAYQEGIETAEQQYAREQADYLARTRAQEAERLSKVQQRRTVATERHTAQEARRQQLARQRTARAVEASETATQTKAREYAEQVQRYEQAVASQSEAVTQARAIPARYTPETPSHVLYKKVGEIAPEAPVTLGRTQEVAAELQDVLGQVPSLQPSRLQALLTDMRAARSTQSLREVQRYLTDLGTLTRSNDSATRRTAKGLYGALHDDLAESAMRLPETEAARDLLLQANATFRREMATRDLSGVIRRAITVGDDGIPRLAPGRALTQFDRLVEGDRFFAGSFPPDDLAQIRSDLADLTSAQKIPPRPGAAPAPVQPQAVEPFTPRPWQEPTIPAGERVVPATRPAMEGTPETWKPRGPELPEPPKPVTPTLAPRDKQPLQDLLFEVGIADVVLGLPGPLGPIAFANRVRTKLPDLLAAMIIDPRYTQRLQDFVDRKGAIDLTKLVALAGGRAALMAERRKKERERR